MTRIKKSDFPIRVIGEVCAGQVEANLVKLNDSFRLSCIPELVARKLSSPERSALNAADLAFHPNR
jgi:hypothetical protein